MSVCLSVSVCACSCLCVCVRECISLSLRQREQERQAETGPCWGEKCLVMVSSCLYDNEMQSQPAGLLTEPPISYPVWLLPSALNGSNVTLGETSPLCVLEMHLNLHFNFNPNYTGSTITRLNLHHMSNNGHNRQKR